MSAYGHGRHEHGQNFLTNHKIINSIIDLVKQTSGPIIEIGPGSGALTHPMAHVGRAITAVEVDAKLAAKITQETSSAAVEVATSRASPGVAGGCAPVVRVRFFAAMAKLLFGNRIPPAAGRCLPPVKP